VLGNRAGDRVGARRIADQHGGAREEETQVVALGEARGALRAATRRGAPARADPEIRLLQDRVSRRRRRVVQRLDRWIAASRSPRASASCACSRARSADGEQAASAIASHARRRVGSTRAAYRMAR
jgi:hypothetical protein